MIVGGGDRAFINAVLEKKQAFAQSYALSPAHAQHYLRWAESLHPQNHQTSLSIGYLPGCLTHLWHGTVPKRHFKERTQILAQAQFDPERDLQIKQGVWRWASDKPELHSQIRQYFALRDEDGLGLCHNDAKQTQMR